MTLATQTIARTHARLTVTPGRPEDEASTRIQILENPVHRHDPGLAVALEEELRGKLRDEGLGFVAVRFRVCHDEDSGFQFICKVENPPQIDTDVMVPWRWWSPLLGTAEEFAAALEDGLRVRRARLSTRAMSA